ncbi:MAG TPA: diguanylate cyclase [bacterium]|nr:diguanylate cyclase [bacterium]
MHRGRILVVDDDQFYQEFCAEILGEEGYQIKSTYTGEEALEILKREKFDIMLLDLIMPGADGVEILEATKQINPQMDVIMMTGYASVESAVRSLKSGAADYLTKPLNPEELKLTIKRTIELRHLFDENAELRNLLTLYETCQRVSLCLDLDKLYRLSLDAVIQALQGDLGLSFFRQNGDWTMKAHRGMEEEEADAMMRELLDHELDIMPNRIMTVDSPSVGREGASGHHLRIRSGLIMPITIPHSLEGIFVIFKKDPNQPFDRMDLGTARFIAEQVHLSFENAFKYMDAQRLVFIDDLTGLFNTRYLDLSLQTELKRAKRFKTHLSLLFIDLDFFKNVNDAHGHLAGSKLLIEIAEVLKTCVREIDVVVRYGGDEFIIILVETDRVGADKVAERIRKSIEDETYPVKEGLTINITCCVGIATFPDDAESKSELIHLADRAMYRGKETTRNVVYAASAL